MKFIKPQLLMDAVAELDPLEQIILWDSMLWNRIVNGMSDNDEDAEFIRDMMDEPWSKCTEEDKARLNRFHIKAGKARY